MRVLSASESISPAIQRTKQILFQPFRKGRSWKLAAVAYLSAMGLAFIPYPLLFFTFAKQIPGTSQNIYLGLIFTVLGLFCTAIMFVFFYLGSRLQFVLFAFTLEKSALVAPLWRRYASRTWPWLGLKLVLSLIVTVIFSAPIFYSFRSLITQAAIQQVQPGQPPSPEMFFALLSFYLFFGSAILILMLCSSLLSDFVLPPIALEGASLSDALGRFLQLIKAEPGQLLLFTLFKILLAIAGMIAMQAVIIIAELILIIPLGLLAFLGWFALHSLGLVGHLLLIAGALTLGLLFLVGFFYVATLVMGCVHTFYQAYALYFLGGRYPRLGDLLEPPAIPSAELPPLPDLS